MAGEEGPVSRVRRGLAILLSTHVEGDTVRYSEMFPVLRALDIPVERVAEVLDEMGVLDDDRCPSFVTWLDRKLDGLAPGAHQEVEAWLRALHDGGPRARARDQATAWNYLNAVRPALVAWSARHAHLREVTRDDVLAELGALHGSRRKNALVGLRSLFAFCKKNGTVFRNPTARIKVGQQEYGVIQPLSSGEVDEAVTTATTPAARLVLALAAVHAARSGAIRGLRLDEVDLANRRLVIAGRARPLDDLTLELFQGWLDHRRARWPSTVNPHLFVNQHTAAETRPGQHLLGQEGTARAHREPSNACASTASSKKPSFTGRARSTSPPCSASTQKPPSVMQTRLASSSKLPPNEGPLSSGATSTLATLSLQ